MASRSDQAGRYLERHVDVQNDARAHARLRLHTVERATRSAPRASLRLAALVAGSVAVGVGVLVWILMRGAPAPVAFQVGADRQRGAVGAYYAAPGAASLAFTFSEGSSVELQPGSGARVSRVDESGASLLLEGGTATVKVQKRAGADFRIHAGPYVVRVAGTEFRIRWDAPAGKLEIEMQSGSVVVNGPGVDGVAIGAGERFVSQTSARVEPAASSAREPAPLPVSSTTPLSPTQDPSASHGASDGPARAEAHDRDAGDAAPSWKTLIRRRDYAAVVKDAERRGIDVALGSSSAEELSALADAARFSGRRDLARRALLAQRTRFPGSSQAVAAAFLLGRMLDEAGDTSGALTYYDRYLAEAPAGSLAGEALGRRMLALERLGNVTASRAAAELYLRRFPNGGYRAVAGELVAP
jgi:TolA-binding protein